MRQVTTTAIPMRMNTNGMNCAEASGNMGNEKRMKP